MECKWCFKILSKGAILLQHPLINDIVSSAADDMKCSVGSCPDTCEVEQT